MPHFESPVHEDSMLEPIAIVGMACRLPGAVDSAHSLWEVLKEKRSMQTPKVPASRFNIDAYLHERLDRPGSFNVSGGYFLNGNAEDFDPSFFNMTPIEAMWLDPQQRKMLEVTYDVLSQQAVRLKTFTSDYQQMSTKDGDFRHNYAATGVDPGLISARIGNTFDLNGPSFTINTACSSSIYAIHNACHALRTRDASAAIAGGVNLILTVDQHMNTAKLGILSPTSTCHTFDASADGYGRAEGAGALYLKRLSDAIRDGDPVRGVIRSSAVNTNGKVAGMGITHPSKAGQERVVRQAYARSGLDPLRTAYVECHGTGTPVGDPIEAHAIGRAMNDVRPSDKPLLIGAIKANIGHSEAASGIFAVMKAALMTEEGVIPGVAGLQNLNPAILEEEWNIKVNAETTPWPAGFSERRVGVSSFGYGGTNGHVIVEAVDALHPLYSHGRKRRDDPQKATRPFLLPFSAHDRPTLERNVAAHAKVAPEYHLADLSYTLGVRRSKFATRGFTVATEPLCPEDLAISAFTIGSAPRSQKDVAFIFTGQGAQWSGLGAKAMQTFPEFRSTIDALDTILQRLDAAIRPTWSLKSVLMASADAPNINDANVAQPVCTAVQIAIIDLFATWGITPTATVGHSSGEIAAAYAAGLLAAPEAMVAAFLRGYAVSHNAPAGSMLAVGLGLVGFEKYAGLLSDNLVIACQNSPESLTLSGTQEAVADAKSVLSKDGIFARELPTGKAYHSPQMNDVATIYDTLLIQAVQGLSGQSLKWRRPRARWFSSVTGTEYIGQIVPASYWSANLRNRVLFDEAVACLAAAPGLEQVAIAIEIGPHSALAGPFKQICRANNLDRFTYIATLVREKDSAVQLLKTAGALFIQDYPVDLEEVNSVPATTGNMKNKTKPLLLVDLPPYQWNYEKRFWTEPRLSHEQRNLTSPRHDLLGSKIVGLSKRSLAWRNVLRHVDLPWLKDHTLGREVVFPAAAHLSMSAEALRQVCDQEGIEIHSVTFRDVQLMTALIIPDIDDGIEVQLRLNKMDEDGLWYTFTVESFVEGEWSLHSTGSIAANYVEAAQHEHPVDQMKLTQRVPGKTWYNAFDRVGFEYGSSFQPLSNIRTNGKYHHAAADVKVDTESGLVVGESRYLLHPSTIDGCLQLIIISINSGMHAEMAHGVVPIKIEELTVWHAKEANKTTGKSVAWTDRLDGRYFNTHTKLFSGSGDMLLDVKNLLCVSYEAAVPQTSTPERPREPYMKAIYKPDIATLTTQQALQAYPSIQSEEDSIAAIVELLHYKKPISSALLLGQPDSNTLRAVLKQVPSSTKLILAGLSEENITDLTKLILAGLSEENITDLTTGIDISNISTITSTEGLFGYGEQTPDPQDLVIVGKDAWSHATKQQLLDEVAALTVKGGKVIFSVHSQVGEDIAGTISHHGFSAPELLFPLPEVTIMSTTQVQNESDGATPSQQSVIMLISDETEKSSYSAFAAVLQDRGCNVEFGHLGENALVRKDAEATYIIYDVMGSLLSSLTEDIFGKLKTVLTGNNPVIWLTTGVNEGSCVSGGMSQGLLRAIRSEHASARILLLDANITEDFTSIGDAVFGQLGHIATKDSGADTEYWLQNGILTIPRVVPNESLNTHFTANTAAPQLGTLTSDKALSGKVGNGELVFKSKQSSDLAEFDVKVQINYATVRKADLHGPTSDISIVAGPISAVGGKLDKTFIGQNAVAYAESPFGTELTASVTVGAFYSDFEETALLATLPNLAEAIHSVLDVGKIQANDRVVLLPAPHEFVIAVAELKQVLGFQLTVIVGSEVEKENLMRQTTLTSSELLLSLGAKPSQLLENIDLVICHDFSRLGQEVWRAMPAASRFVLHNAVVEGSLDGLPFSKGVSFFLSGVRNLYKTRPHVLGDLLTRTMSFMKEHNIIRKPNVYDIDSLKDLTQFCKALQIQPLGDMIEFLPDVAYFLVGCLGGLGRSLTTFMLERGARDFVFLSRSGADKPEAAALVESIQKAGAKVQVFRGDAGIQADVDRAVSEVTATRHIRGVIHAAMVLQDGMFENMTFSQFQVALKPKVNSAVTLHKAFENVPLDFFVMTSSISATMGNPGQANYCAGNSYLDSLAWYRNLRGLPATSLILPMVLDVGVVAENSEIEEALSQKAMYGIDERELLRGFETAMLQRPKDASSSVGNAQIILGLEPSYLAKAIAAVGDPDDAYWYQDARFAHLRVAVEDIRRFAGNNSERAGSFIQELETVRALGNVAVLHAISGHIVKKLSNMLLIPVEEFAFEGNSISVYGIDSMIGADLRNWLYKLFGLEITFQHLLAPSMTILALASAVAENLGFLEKTEA
uniref:Lovastatin nonaketide synthase n=1 Tax=Talaromyces marneffei PM1 TaxID=1077442 RepID=A0A093UTY9_TALMA